MNAVEAKQLSEANKRTPLERKYLRAQARIKETAKEGEFCVSLPFMDSAVRVLLAAEGYMVTYSQRDHYTYVNW